VAAIVAADLGSAMAQDPALDVDDYLKREYAQLQRVYAVMKASPVASNRSSPLQEDILRSVQSVLAGTDFRRTGTEPAVGGPPFVMAPIQVANQLRGIVVLPLAPPNPIARDVGRFLSVPGTALLIIATIVAAAVIFGPARRRLKSLQ